MCGRYTLTFPDLRVLARLVQATADATVLDQHRQRYNIAPRQPAPIVVAEADDRHLVRGHWDFPGPTGTLINARAETAATLPTFRHAFRNGRCGVLADGFLEWSGPPKQRQPLWFRRRDRGLLVFAGLNCTDQDPATGATRRRFVILTTAANKTLATYHHRMPVVLSASALAAWIDPSGTHSLAKILVPAPDDLLSVTPVDARVNSPRHDDPACLAPTGETFVV